MKFCLREVISAGWGEGSRISVLCHLGEAPSTLPPPGTTSLINGTGPDPLAAADSDSCVLLKGVSAILSHSLSKLLSPHSPLLLRGIRNTASKLEQTRVRAAHAKFERNSERFETFQIKYRYWKFGIL